MDNELTGKRLRGALSERFAGQAISPSDASYNAIRSVWNATVDKHPALIARCQSASDVAAAVLAAREVGVPLSVRGGGHQVAGLSVCDAASQWTFPRCGQPA